jgi:hypothetical protein
MYRVPIGRAMTGLAPIVSVTQSGPPDLRQVTAALRVGRPAGNKQKLRISPMYAGQPGKGVCAVCIARGLGRTSPGRPCPETAVTPEMIHAAADRLAYWQCDIRDRRAHSRRPRADKSNVWPFVSRILKTIMVAPPLKM